MTTAQAISFRETRGCLARCKYMITGQFDPHPHCTATLATWGSKKRRQSVRSVTWHFVLVSDVKIITQIQGIMWDWQEMQGFRTRHHLSQQLCKEKYLHCSFSCRALLLYTHTHTHKQTSISITKLASPTLKTKVWLHRMQKLKFKIHMIWKTKSKVSIQGTEISHVMKDQ